MIYQKIIYTNHKLNIQIFNKRKKKKRVRYPNVPWNLRVQVKVKDHLTYCPILLIKTTHMVPCLSPVTIQLFYSFSVIFFFFFSCDSKFPIHSSLSSHWDFSFSQNRATFSIIFMLDKQRLRLTGCTVLALYLVLFRRLLAFSHKY